MVRSFDGLRNITQSFALALAGRIREQQRTKPTGLPIVLIATLSPVDRRRSGGRCLELHRPRRREFEFLLREEVWRGIQSVLVGKTAGDWTCQQSKNNRRPISVEKACKMQYGKSGLKAKALAWGDPLSWRCFAKAEEITSRAQLYSQNPCRFRAFMSRWKWFLCASLAAGPSVVPNTSQASSCTVLMKTLCRSASVGSCGPSWGVASGVASLGRGAATGAGAGLSVEASTGTGATNGLFLA